MITTVTLNPTIDRAYTIHDFELNKTYKLNKQNIKITASGRGINVAKVASALGEQVNATGFLDRYLDKFVQDEMGQLKIHTSFIKIQEPSQVLTAIVDPLNNTQTIVKENEPVIDKAELNAFVKEFVKSLKYSSIMIAAGSVPKGLPQTIYGDMVKIAKDNNVKMIIDAKGSYLKEAIKAKPFMVQSSVHELEKLVGYPLHSNHEIIFECKHICKQGVDIIGIFQGQEGALFVTSQGAYKVNVPNVQIEDRMQTGDGLVAGFAVAICRKNHLEEAFKMAVATEMASIKAKGLVDKNQIEQFYKQIEIRKLD